MTIVLMRSVDFETSRKEDGDPIELGITDVFFDTETKVATVGRMSRSWLFWPMRGMDPCAQGVHHISLDELDGCPSATSDRLQDLVMEGAPDFLVAHNASFEQAFLTPDLTGDARWVCTFKAARRAWEEAPEHNLQTLRYWRRLTLDNALALPAHRAGPDSYVGAHVLAELLKTETVNDLVKWTKMPLHHPVCPLRPHAGQPWTSVPYKYLTWMLGKDDMDADLKLAANNEINRRKEIGS